MKRKIIVLLNILWLLILIPNSINAINIDSLEQVTSKMSDSKDKVDHLILLGKELFYINKKKSLKYRKQALVSSKKLNYTIDKKQLYFDIGTTFMSLSGDSAGYYLDLALNLSEEGEDDYLLADIYNAKGALQYNRGKQREALLLYYEAEQFATISNNIEALPEIYNNIGLVFAATSDKESIVYFKKAYNAAQQKGLENQRLRATINLGTVLRMSNQIDSSLFYLQEALKLNKTVNNKYLSINIYLNLSISYQNKGDLAAMKQYALKSLEVTKELNNKNGINLSYQNLQGVEFKLGNYKKAIEYGEYIFNNTPHYKAHSLILVYKTQAKAYRALGDYKNVLIYQDTVLILNDSIYNLREEENIKELEKKISTRKIRTTTSRTRTTSKVRTTYFIWRFGFNAFN